jgi:Na+/H+ antiporter NhaD/arsenite permease-like protein
MASHLPLAPLLIFIATYLGLALGRIPGLAVDRTGIALLGAVAMLAARSVTVEEAKAAVDAPTMILLFGMMVLSVQYRLAGLYAGIARRLAGAPSPRRMLAGVIVVAAALSAVLTNDVVCFALTPVLVVGLKGAGLNPLPYLLALACATNIGSAATPIGNPQNILISQRMGLSFGPFVLHCIVPVALSLVALYLLVVRSVPKVMPARGPVLRPEDDAPLLRGQAAKAIVLTVAAIALFLTPIPAGLIAMAVAGVILASRRMHTRTVLGLVDWHLLALFVGLFVVVRGLETSGWVDAAARLLAAWGADLAVPTVSIPVVSVLGNLVGNVPAVMLLLPLTPPEPIAGYALALASTLAGNAVLVGSIANLIVADHAEREGVRFGFREHLRVGLPITLISLVLAVATMALWR